MKPFKCIVFTGIICSVLFSCRQKPLHDITFNKIKELKPGMTYKEVTDLIGLPDEVHPFTEMHSIDSCKFPKNYVFKPDKLTNIKETVNSIYADSIICCSGMRESRNYSLPYFIYENAQSFLSHPKIYVHFSRNGKLSDFAFLDRGLFSKTDDLPLYFFNDSSSQYPNSNKTNPAYTDEEIEKEISKL